MEILIAVVLCIIATALVLQRPLQIIIKHEYPTQLPMAEVKEPDLSEKEEKERLLVIDSVTRSVQEALGVIMDDER